MSEPGSRRGRPHDAEGTREAILNAAEEEFAHQGFDGARVDVIAAKASYNKSLIFQYFGDKLGLYAEVIRRADEQLRELQLQIMALLLDEASLESPQRLKEALTAFAGAYFDYLIEHPRITRIYNWEMAEGWQTYTKIIEQRERDMADFVNAKPILEKVQAAGFLRSNLNPFLQFGVAIYLCNCYLGSLPILQGFMNEDLSSPTALARAREFVCEFIAHGLMVTFEDVQPKMKQ